MEGSDSQELKAQHKKAEEELSKLPANEKQKIQPILELQLQRNTLYTQFLKELRELEFRYDQQYDPLYLQRSELLKNFSGFWLNAMRNNPMIASMIFDQDYELLKHLVNVKLVTEQNSSNFSLEFHFTENSFITNQVLVKKYILNDDDEVKSAVGTDIKWKGTNLTQKVKKTKKKGKNKKVGTKVEEIPSFFLFFKSIDENDMEDDDDEDELADNLEDDYEIGREFRDELIPNAILYYLNVVDSMDDDDVSEGSDEGKAKPKAKKIDGSGTEKPECKPQ
jgi:nucleosome assembly protein 1-like 1